MIVLSTLLILLTMPHQTATDDKLLIDEFSSDEHLNWYIVNDGVMGGMSQSKVTYTEDGTAVFSGNLSLENNGGFASTRATLKQSVDGISAVQLKVRGDGQRYSLRFRTSERFDGPSYVASFDTKENEWTTIDIPLSDFVLQFRGYQMRDQPELKGEDIRQVALLIADNQEGQFQIEIDYLYGLVQ